MADLYELMNETAQDDLAPKEEFDRKAWGAKKQVEREETYAKIDETALAVNSDPAARDRYLDVMARFPNHSVQNTLLIYAQRPNASRIGDGAYWASKGARIKKNERGFSVLEPGREYTREDGSIGTFYDPKKVFDAEQTTARTRLPRHYDAHDVLTALITTSPIPVRPVDDLQGELAVYDPHEKAVLVQRGLTEDQLFWALATEISQASLSEGKANFDREGNAGKAELAAGVLAKRYGVEQVAGDYPAPAHKEADSQEIRAALTEVRNAVQDTGNRLRAVLDKPKDREQAMRR